MMVDQSPSASFPDCKNVTNDNLYQFHMGDEDMFVMYTDAS